MLHERLEARELQRVGQRLRDVGVVVDDEHAGRGVPSVCAWPALRASVWRSVEVMP